MFSNLRVKIYSTDADTDADLRTHHDIDHYVERNAFMDIVRAIKRLQY